MVYYPLAIVGLISSMARPSLKEKRFEEILDAFERCVARYGLAGATLEQVAAEAGLARPLIRHHIGNRNDLVNALINRFQKNSDLYMQAMVTGLPETGRLAAFIDRLFDDKYFDRNLVLVTEALIAAATDYPQLEKQLIGTIESIVTVISDELSREYPTSSDNSIQEVATGILGIYFNVDSLSMLGGMESFRTNSKQAAIRLTQTFAS